MVGTNNIDTSKINFIETNSLSKIHSIVAVSLNTLLDLKDMKIFAVFIINLNIQLQKQENKKVIKFKSIMLAEYHDFLNVFSKKKRLIFCPYIINMIIELN